MTPILNAALPDGTRAETLNIRQPNTQRQQQRARRPRHHARPDAARRLQLGLSSDENLGVGNYDLPERGVHATRTSSGRSACRRRGRSAGARSSTRGSRSAGSTSRMTLSRRGADDRRAGCVQRRRRAAGAEHPRQAVHAWRPISTTCAASTRGAAGIADRRATGSSPTAASTHLGTYTFSSLDDYRAGRPVALHALARQSGVSYYNLQGAVYCPGRHPRAPRADASARACATACRRRSTTRRAFEPRFGLTWAPSANGRTTLRGSVGIFHSFMPPPVDRADRCASTASSSARSSSSTRRIRIRASTPASCRRPTIPDRRLQPAAQRALQRRHRPGAVDPRLRFNVLYNYIHLQQQPRGNEPECAGQRRPSGPDLRQRHRDRHRHRDPPPRAVRQRDVNLAAQSPALQQALLQLAAAEHQRQLFVHRRAEQQRRSVGGAADRQHRGRLGTRSGRLAVPRAAAGDQHAAQEPHGERAPT